MPDNPSPNQGWTNKAAGPEKKDNAGWKQKPEAKPGGSGGGGTRDWHGKTATAAGLPRATSWGARLAVAVGLFSLLIVGVVAAILLLRPLRPACLVLLGASYDVNLALPHNAYGWLGLQDLAEHADKTGFVDSLFSAPSHTRLAYPPTEPGEIQGKKSWDKLWGDMPKAFSQKTVIIFLAMHGGADGKGAFLFLGDKQGQEKVYLKTILDALPEKVPGKNIILVLEPAQVGAHWPSGMLRNHFVRKLKELKAEIEAQPGLLVLCASDDDQISWPSEEWRQTIFAHYLIEGLQGAADQTKYGGNANSRVTAAELFNYVKVRVSAWAQSTRGAAQTPILLGGQQRAEKIELVQIPAPYTEKGIHEAPGGKFTASRELEEAWKSCAGLSRQVPAPEVYTPHLWRWYRDTLLRWEQLERAGASSGRIALLKGDSAVLERQIKNQSKARADLTSWEITRAVALPGVLGAAPTEAAANDQLIREFWPLLWQAKNEDEQRKVLQNLRTRAKVGEDLTSEQGMALYGQLCRHLLTTVSPDDFKAPASLKARVRFLERAFDLNKKRPAEINYLMALLNDLDPEAMPPGQDLKLAMGVRLLAEDAALAAPGFANPGHSYSEMINPWISLKIKEADEQRRRGEDYLFGGAKEWKLARELLGSAKGNYEEALKDAAVIREALDLRDRALADLPYYAEWLARRPLPPGAEPAEKLEKLVRQVENLSHNVGQLAWALKAFQGHDLRKSQPERNSKDLSRKELLVQWIREVKNDFKDPEHDLAHQFKLTCQELQSAADQPLLWQGLEAALATPLIDPDLRKTMLAKSHSLSRKFLEEFHEEKEKRSKEEAPEDVADRERRQERLALAVLVPQWQDHHPLEIALAKDNKSAPELAREIGAYWQKLAGQIMEKYSASCQSIDLQGTAEPLREADFLCRLLPGGTVAWLAPAWKSDLPYGPPQGLRNLRLHDLLLDQSARARNDYWFTETREPYYAPAAKAYARMAQDLAVAGNNEIIISARKKKAKEFADIAETRLAAQPPANPNWTSEPEFALTWRIGAPRSVPKGVPMYWLRMEEGALKAVQKPAIFQRQAASSWPPEKTYSLENPSEKERNDADRKSREATFYCVYRGQEIKSTQELRFCKPDRIVRHFPPEKAGLAFRLDKGFDYGAISILLDCSGSMVMETNKIRGKTRFEHAINALDEALQSIPDDTFVSLLIFITIEASGGEPRFELLQEPAKWKQADRADLIRKVRRLKIYQGASPIARALVVGRDRGFPTLDRYDGPKLILALTDGDDNWSFPPTDPEVMNAADRQRYNLKVADYLRKKFEGRKTEIQIVCFNDGKNAENRAEIDRATEQFKKTIEDNLDPPGTFRVQPDPAKLADDLKNAARPKLHLQTAFKAVAGFPKEGKPVNPYRGNTLDWLRDLDPVQYTAWVQNRKDENIPDRNIRLYPGDYMIVTLKRNRKNRDIIFERSLFANEVLAPKITKGSLVISALQNQIDKENALHQLIAVEQMTTADSQPLLIQQQPLGFFWLEAKPRSATPSGPVSWRRDYGYPAPAFRLKIQDWPFEAGDWTPAETTLWWSVSKYPENALIMEPKGTGSLKDRFSTGSPLPVDNPRIRIEDVRVEDQEVETVTGEKVKKSCLSVRLSHEAKKPVFVLLKPRGEGPYREEHRFYSEANKYTALFWDLPDPQSAQFSLYVIFLDDFKAECQTENRWARFDSLDRMDLAGPQRVGLPGSP